MEILEKCLLGKDLKTNGEDACVLWLKDNHLMVFLITQWTYTIKKYKMSLYRARSKCPICSQEEEVWFQNGKIEPLDIVECPKCSQLYEPQNFISTFLDLRQNSTISSNYAVMTSTL